MLRKFATAAVGVMALLFSVLALDVSASQTFDDWVANGGLYGDAECPYDLATIAPELCADAIDYTGPFTVHPPAPTGPYGWGPAPITPGDSTGAASSGATAGTTGAAGLAHTGAESGVLGYVGAGLIGFGAIALGARRRT